MRCGRKLVFPGSVVRSARFQGSFELKETELSIPGVVAGRSCTRDIVARVTEREQACGNFPGITHVRERSNVRL